MPSVESCAFKVQLGCGVPLTPRPVKVAVFVPPPVDVTVVVPVRLHVPVFIESVIESAVAEVNVTTTTGEKLLPLAVFVGCAVKD